MYHDLADVRKIASHFLLRIHENARCRNLTAGFRLVFWNVSCFSVCGDILVIVGVYVIDSCWDCMEFWNGSVYYTASYIFIPTRHSFSNVLFVFCHQYVSKLDCLVSNFPSGIPAWIGQTSEDCLGPLQSMTTMTQCRLNSLSSGICSCTLKSVPRTWSRLGSTSWQWIYSYFSYFLFKLSMCGRR